MEKQSAHRKRILLPIIIVLAIILVGILSYRSFFGNLSENQARQIALEYLNTKYGDGDWQLYDSFKDAGYSYNGFVKSHYDRGYVFTATSSYTNGEAFTVQVANERIVTTDSFLPTYYSIKYGFKYRAPSVNDLDGDYEDLLQRMVYISDYHYPYDDYKYDSSGALIQRPKARIFKFEMGSFYSPISVTYSPEAKKILDIIPDDGSIPEIRDIINEVEDYYSSGLTRNRDHHDDELYSLVFEEKASYDQIERFISEHITPIAEYEPMYKYR